MAIPTPSGVLMDWPIKTALSLSTGPIFKLKGPIGFAKKVSPLYSPQDERRTNTAQIAKAYGQ